MGIYDCQGRRLKISRSQKLRVWIDEEEVEGSAAYKQQKIEQLIGCNLEILQILTYHPQRVSGQFLNQTDSEKKDFLTQILGLELFETAVEKTEKELHEKIRESGLSVREFEIYERQYELLNEREFLENISIRTLSEYEYELKNIYETIEMLSKRISSREQLIEEAQKTYEEHTQQSREFFQEEIASLDKPEEIKAKVLEGKVNDYFKEKVLLSQPFIKNPDLTIEQRINEVVQKTGEKVAVGRFIRYSVLG
jgi:translation elongation factor EF-Ts